MGEVLCVREVAGEWGCGGDGVGEVLGVYCLGLNKEDRDDEESIDSRGLRFWGLRGYGARWQILLILFTTVFHPVIITTFPIQYRHAALLRGTFSTLRLKLYTILAVKEIR